MAPDPKRLELQTLLEGLLGNSRVYFQRPPNNQMTYDAIIYKLDDVKTKFADNRPYSRAKRYQVTVISRDPDTDIPDKIGQLPKCDFERSMTVDNLYHYIYNLYF
jgi:hypothetical protein